jgi:DNA-directed RNA polymerase specialized sigma24 family protein
LTSEAFDKLLDHFSPDPEEAARRYEVMRVKLIRYFEWRSCPLPEDEADLTIDRVTRRIDEGENIFNLNAYFFTVARLVFMETLKRRERPTDLDAVLAVPAASASLDEKKETRLRCLDDCLDKLPIESRSLILGYYQDEGGAKIARRRQLAEALGIPLNALRIRAHRVRTILEKCVAGCLVLPKMPRNEIG